MKCYSYGCYGRVIKIVRVHTDEGDYDFPCCKKHEIKLKDSARYSHFKYITIKVSGIFKESSEEEGT